MPLKASSLLVFISILFCQQLPGQIEWIKDAWKAFDQAKFEQSISLAQKCIDKYHLIAEDIQKELDSSNACCPTGYVNKEVLKKCNEHGVLNDMSAAYYIKGMAILELLLRGKRKGEKDYKEALNTFEQICRLNCGRVWDARKKWFWSPCEAVEYELKHFKSVINQNRPFKPEDLFDVEPTPKILGGEDISLNLLMQGEAHMIKKQYRLALRKFYKIRRIYFYSYINRYASYQIGHINYVMGRKEDALLEFTLLINGIDIEYERKTAYDESDNSFIKLYYQSLKIRSEIYYKRKEYDLAIKDALEALTFFKEEQWLIKQVADSYLRLNQYYKAQEFINNALNKDPYNKDLWEQFDLSQKLKYSGEGDHFLKNKEFESAIQSYTNYIEIDTTQVSIYFKRGSTHYLLKQYEQAERDLVHVIERDSNNATSYNLLGKTYAYRGNFNQAIKHLNQALKLNPTENIFFTRANVYRILEKYDLAIADYTTLLKQRKDPEEICYSYYYRGICYKIGFELQKANQDFLDAVKCKEGFWEAYQELILTSARMGNYEQVRESLISLQSIKGEGAVIVEKLSKPFSDKTKLVDQLVWIADYLNNKDEYLQELIFETILSLDPSYAKIYLLKGQKKLFQGEFSHAIIYFSNYIFLQPKDYIGYYFRGNCYLNNQEFNRAIKDLTKAKKLSPNDKTILSDILSQRGQAYYNKKKYKGALRDFTKAIELKESGQFYYQRAILYYETNEITKACLDARGAKQQGYSKANDFIRKYCED